MPKAPIKEKGSAKDRLEDRIRDYLADHLDLLEPGLSLIKKEHVLENPIGAGGKVDILARDRFGLFVVIEIKRSDQAARQTLNEIHKYSALLRTEQGLDETQVRIMILSTEWHELRVPLSECIDSFPYAINPFLLHAQADGKVTEVERVDLIPKSGIIQISRQQAVYCFEKRPDRDAAVTPFSKLIIAAGISDFCILCIDYKGTSPAVVYGFAIYLFFASPIVGLPPAELEKIKQRIEWDETLNELDENFLVAINENEAIWDDFEIGYPEKLTTILREWSVSSHIRFGRLESANSLLSDQEVMRLAQAVGGGSPVYLCKLCSPRLGPVWRQFKEDLSLALAGMPNWERILPKFLCEIGQNSSVSASVFNPGNLMMTLYWIAWAKDFSKCPHLEVVVEEPNQKRVRILVSLLSWNGKIITESPSKMVDKIFGDLDHWMAAQHFHETHLHEAKALKLHQLSARTVEFTYNQKEPAEPKELLLVGNDLSRKEIDVETLREMDQFAKGNEDYLSQLRLFMESITIGLPGSEIMQRKDTAE